MPRGSPVPVAGHGWSSSLARAKEAAEQLRQRQATQRDMAAAQDGGRAGASRPVAGSGTRLEQQLVRAKAAAAQLRQQRGVQRAGSERQPTRQAEADPGATKLAQQVSIARRVAARLRQRARERADGLELSLQALTGLSSRRGGCGASVLPAWEDRTACKVAESMRAILLGLMLTLADTRALFCSQYRGRQICSAS